MQAVNIRLIRLTQYAVRLSRKDLRLLVGLLTGHNTLNRHITLLRRMDDPLCPLCKEEDTSLHLLGNCCAIAKKRCEFFERHPLGPSDLRQVTLEHISQVCKKLQVSVTLGLIRDAHWARWRPQHKAVIRLHQMLRWSKNQNW